MIGCASTTCLARRDRTTSTALSKSDDRPPWWSALFWIVALPIYPHRPSRSTPGIAPPPVYFSQGLFSLGPSLGKPGQLLPYRAGSAPP
jgi:hypothetical protein